MKKYLHTTHRSVLWFTRAHENGELQINPPFQRNPVWTKQQKSFLIDTILNEYPIPELYMQNIIKDDGKADYVIVDGQQRIRACLEFINNEFELHSKDSPDWADMYFDDLTPGDKRKIYEYEFVVRILPEMTQPEIREIFTRLNRNTVALNSQELRQAIYWGEFISTINELTELESWSELGIFTQNDIRRMLDAEYISELVIAHLHGVQNKKQTIDKYYQIYEVEFEENRKIKNLFLNVSNEILKILPEIRKTRWKKKTDFYTLFLEFSSHENRLPLTKGKRDLANQILINFGKNVDSFVKTDDEKDQKDFSEEVRKYALAIRAGTDLGNRKRRKEVLNSEFEEIWK